MNDLLAVALIFVAETKASRKEMIYAWDSQASKY